MFEKFLLNYSLPYLLISDQPDTLMISRPKGIHGTDFSKNWCSFIKCPRSSTCIPGPFCHKTQALLAHCPICRRTHLTVLTLLGLSLGCWGSFSSPGIKSFTKRKPQSIHPPLIPQRAISPEWVLSASISLPSSTSEVEEIRSSILPGLLTSHCLRCFCQAPPPGGVLTSAAQMGLFPEIQGLRSSI